MKAPQPHDDWPASWRTSYEYDRLELWGHRPWSGYSRAYALRREQALRLLTEVLPAGASILDVAAGQGNFSLRLAEAGFRVTWNDLRGELVDYVRSKHEAGVIDFAPGNAFDIQFPQPFDAVLATDVIEHVAHPDEFVVKLARLVKPGGILVLSTPNGAYWRSGLPRFSDIPDPTVLESLQFKPDADGHLFLLHPDELVEFAQKAGLSVESMTLYANSLTAGHVKLERLLPLLPNRIVQSVENFTQRLPDGARRVLLCHMAIRLRRAG